MRGLRFALLCAALGLVAGCEDMRRGGGPPSESAPPAAAPAPRPTPEAVAEAFAQLNSAFEKEYERILAERGTRSFRVRPAVAYDALLGALTRLRMIIESRDALTGTLTVAAPAPRPLSAQEWRQVVQTDGPMMLSILCPRLGPYCKTLSFEPEDYVIVINATVLPARNGGSEVSLTTRMREVVPRPGVPRRDYPPPTGVRMALDKIWAGFERELAAGQPPSRTRK